jgi:comEA protein
MRVWSVLVFVILLAVGGTVWFVPRLGAHDVKNSKWEEQMVLLPETRNKEQVSKQGVVEPSPLSTLQPTRAPQPAPTKGDGKIHLNLATAVELDALPGIGPSKAALIIAYRNEHGAFSTLEELQLVKGIGERTFEKLAPLLELN